MKSCERDRMVLLSLTVVTAGRVSDTPCTTVPLLDVARVEQPRGIEYLRYYRIAQQSTWNLSRAEF